MKKQASNYRNVSENPCNMCMPLGGILAFKGIEGSMTVLHGSQGCATYMRRTISEHYEEPVDVASSSLNEKGTVFGGEDNLKKALENVRLIYNPQIIGVLTTCLAETIGEDIGRITSRYLQGQEITGLPIINVPTPGYGGSHSEGYWLTVYRIVCFLAEKTAKHNKVNVIVPHISTADLREIKRLLAAMGIDYTLLPDYTDTLDAPYSKPYQKSPAGGTKIEEIRKMSGARATLEMGITIDDAQSAGKYLRDEFGVPLFRVPLPVGIENTDLFFSTLKEIANYGTESAGMKSSGTDLPEEIKKARGRLLDGMFDSHKHNFEGQAVIFGEPEQVYAVTKLCLENGIKPAIMATGSRTKKIEQILQQEFDKLSDFDSEYSILGDTDFSHILEQCKNRKINIAIGHSEGKILTERAEIPLVRFGFPVIDRVGGQRILSVGYEGSLRFLDRITNTLLENKYKNYRANMFALFYEAKVR
ncbi:Nitrogenase FeMo-cofactor scaffold and assembly protein NifN [Dehalobacter sp. UNSWDHB]|jgi:Nitrogenase molybdenum-iron protein, alpha and beta chains|uniref:nitrogenase component 1 n=1 Tax=unclassified Dehalobacter TaxID=2635733 RepID=UPI00028BA0D3|nr:MULTISPECIES: nitrogenase component 1 [unclassified Dehalobacter]AFV03027.1 Nitrogenase FeMo-cofactor scaffold and assembly protein NifN [Dehalobacter sp. DCA]AFV06015.1 Nitrogenase FeMo-cofactor scaffold and assembly protein NifN [Dehalobacter sp. CF]EQB22519.1 Nitrogenase FeMo-cofactor scaffold and assembly protein NifN [Dehalobacter sp. UNSWDHB]